MPTVPTTFVPQVAPGGAGDIGMVQAPQVAVTENLAAQQQVQFGRAMTQAGDVSFRIGSAIQDAIDESEAKAADTAFIQQANTILRGQNGYLRTSGKDAESRYAETVDSLAQMGQGTLDGLRNDTQRAMVRNSMSRNMVTFQSQILDHRDKEVKTFTVNESRARAEQYGQLAIEDYKNRAVPMSDYAINLGVAENEIRTAGRALGWTDDSAQMQAAIKQVRTQVTDGVVNRLMLESDYDEAYKFVKAELKAGNLEEKAAQPLLSSIDANRDRWMIDQYATTIKGYGRVGMPDDESNNPQDAPGSLRDALDIADGIKDQEIRKGVQAALRTQYGQEEALQRQEYGLLIDRMEQFLATPGNTVANVPPSAWGRLKPQDQAKFLKAQRQTDELDVMEEIARNPGVLTREYLEDNRGRMTRDTYIKLLGDVNAPGKVIAATVDADQLEATLFANNMTKMADPKSDEDKQASLMFRNSVKTMIDAEQERQKRPLSREEKQRVIDGAIIQYGEQAYVERSWWWDKQMSLGAMTPEQRQSAYVMVGDAQVKLMDMPQTWITGTALPAFRKAGVSNPTMTQLADYWIRKGKPAQ
jgi:hypothetical protein